MGIAKYLGGNVESCMVIENNSVLWGVSVLDSRKDYMKKKLEISNNMVCIAAAILGAVIFLCLYGIKILNPTYVEWLYNGRDLMQHYLGWEFFRKSDWMFPVGLTDQLGYPSKTSIIFTDSLPIFAVFFKLFANVLPERFQYFGIWGLLCFILQGFFAAKILQVYVKKNWQIIAGSLVFILAPTVLFRMYMHTALASQWIILIAVYLCAVHKDNYRNNKKTSLQWGILGFLIPGIHLYFAPMCAVLLAGYVVYSILNDKKISVKCVFPIVTFLIGIGGNAFLLGGFSSDASSGSSNLGVHSFNLNSFFNAMGYSKVLDSFDTYTNGQYEGFSYLGLGVIILLLLACIYYIWKLITKQMKINIWSWIVTGGVLLCLTVLAASQCISFGTHLLIELPDIDMIMKYWSIFGSSGRLIWPVYYIVMFFAMIGALKIIDEFSDLKKIGNFVFMCCLLLQIFDLSGKLGEIHENYKETAVYEEVFTDEIWDKVAKKDYDHLVWVSHNTDGYQILHMAKFAFDNHMTMNNYYFARGIDFRENVKAEMKNINTESVYVFKPGDPFDYEMYQNYEDKLYLYEADGYVIGSVEPIE